MKTKKPYKISPASIAYITFLRTADKMGSLVENFFLPYGIIGQQYNVLRILRGAEPEGLPTLTIAERMITRAPGITRMIDRLEAKGLVQRQACPDDRRCVYCRVTEKGLDVLAKLDEPVQEMNRTVLRGLDDEEIEQLTALLQKALDALE